jgi:hypothetical protein
MKYHCSAVSVVLAFCGANFANVSATRKVFNGLGHRSSFSVLPFYNFKNGHLHLAPFHPTFWTLSKGNSSKERHNDTDHTLEQHILDTNAGKQLS